MGRHRHPAEEIVNKLRQADVEPAKGSTVTGVCQLLAIGEQAYYAWRREYGGLKVDQGRGQDYLGTRVDSPRLHSSNFEAQVLPHLGLFYAPTLHADADPNSRQPPRLYGKMR